MVTNILYIPGFSVRICILRLGGHKGYLDRHTDIGVEKYTDVILLNILYFVGFSIRTSTPELEAVRIIKYRGQKAYHEGLRT